MLEDKIKEMENEKKQPYWKKILSTQNCSFFTNIDKIELFHTLYDKVTPLVRIRYQYKYESQPIRLFQETSKWENGESLAQKMSFFSPL